MPGGKQREWRLGGTASSLPSPSRTHDLLPPSRPLAALAADQRAVGEFDARQLLVRDDLRRGVLRRPVAEIRAPRAGAVCEVEGTLDLGFQPEIDELERQLLVRRTNR